MKPKYPPKVNIALLITTSMTAALAGLSAAALILPNAVRAHNLHGVGLSIDGTRLLTEGDLLNLYLIYISCGAFFLSPILYLFRFRSYLVLPIYLGLCGAWWYIAISAMANGFIESLIWLAIPTIQVALCYLILGAVPKFADRPDS